MYGAQELKTAAMDIVVRNMTGLMETEEWKECKEKSPHIGSEVAESLAKTAVSNVQILKV